MRPWWIVPGILGFVLSILGSVRANLIQMPFTTGGGSCSQSTAFFTRVAALPATLDTTHHNAYDTMICGLVTDGVWATLDALWVPATNTVTGTNTAVAKLNLVSSSFTLTQHGSPTFTADAGYTGVDGGTSTANYFDTGYNPSTSATHYTLTAAHSSAWSLNNLQASASGGTMLGVDDGTEVTSITPWFSDGNFYGQVNGLISGGNTNAPISSSLGSSVGVRTTSSSAALYRNGAALSAVQFTGSSVLLNGNIYLLANDVSGTVSSNSGNLLAAASLGGLLNATTAPAVSSSGGTTGTGLVPRLCTYLTTGHGSC